MTVYRFALLGRGLAAAWLAGLACGAAQAACPPDGQTEDSLRALRAAHWQVPDGTAVEPLALGLLDCLASPDPELRDDLATEALTAWMRGGQLKPEAIRRIGNLLLPELQPDTPDPDGVLRPFAALVLSEVARADRQHVVYTPEERDKLVDAAAAYLAGVRDYRGFDEQAGWRHGVAHGADLAMQLVLDPLLDRGQVARLLDAVAQQVLPPGDTFYRYGEGERLARPVLFAAHRGLFDKAYWDAWIGKVAVAALPAEGEPTTQASLARLANAKGFLWPVYAAVQEGSDDTLKKTLLPAVLDGLRQLP